jgi:CDP-glycerol glycerophosphotransferase
MKIDKSNYRHWLYLAIFTVNVCFALVLRALCGGNKNKVILYGHKLNGNLKAIQDHALTLDGGPELLFLTMDPGYYRTLKTQGRPVLSGLNPLHMFSLASAYALISDHGLHSLSLLLKFSDMKFVDVWHGIPFKGFDAEDFRVQHQYDEVWVPSGRLRDLYVTRFGFSPDIVHVTGYARTDELVVPRLTREHVVQRLGIPTDGKVVLFAPTWQQDDSQRSIFPFGLEESAFLHRINEFCETHGAVCILRKHLNVRGSEQAEYPRVFFRSYEDFPEAEEVLIASDVLVCDWSSIAFDYLLLDRPTLFLDVPPPFRKGFSLDASYRFGKIVDGMDDLLVALQAVLSAPEDYWRDFGLNHQKVRQEIYERLADGCVAGRCYERLVSMSAASS